LALVFDGSCIYPERQTTGDCRTLQIFAFLSFFSNTSFDQKNNARFPQRRKKLLCRLLNKSQLKSFN
jgi:hypothetical protein